MSPRVGLIFAFLFVLLESGQFVYFGSLFQKVDSFLFGSLVFGLTVIVFTGWTFIVNPDQLKTAFALPRPLIAVNIGAVITFTAYLISVQLLEPAITYTISAGTMPITAYVLHRLGVREGEDMRNRVEAIGNFLIFTSIIFLAIITLSGLSGFVRGDKVNAIIGVFLAIIDGIFFTLILVYSKRLQKAGVGASAVLGLRLPLYVLVTGLIAYRGYDPVEFIPMTQLGIYVAIGFMLTIPPLYFLQRAIATLSTLTISAITALGPFVIFSLQLVEGRIDYSFLTMAGLFIYCCGALLATIGAVGFISGNNTANSKS